MLNSKKVEDHTLSAICGCLFNIIPSNRTMRHAVVTRDPPNMKGGIPRQNARTANVLVQEHFIRLFAPNYLLVKPPVIDLPRDFPTLYETFVFAYCCVY
jgi:hypothetical protein